MLSTKYFRNGSSDIWKTKRQLQDLYLEKVTKGAFEDVKTLFELCKNDDSFVFDRDAADRQKEKTALTIAIEQKNIKMCSVLLEHKVKTCHNKSAYGQTCSIDFAAMSLLIAVPKIVGFGCGFIIY